MTSTFRQTDDKQRVLDATDIVRLIGEHVALKAKGREYVGLCPFHNDHKPSMGVVPHKQIYHCFSCGTGGDAFSFVMNFHKMNFREALEYLAERAGIALTPLRSGRPAADAGTESLSRAALVSANLTANDFFRTILAHPEHGRAAREVVARRGISPEMVDLFQLGAAPDKWDGLALTIGQKRLDPAPFRALGLFKPRDSGGEYDAFRNRLIFPIHDQIGRVIGFGGRKIREEDEPKYLNSPESVLFDKSTTLYGLHQAAQAIRTSRVAIVTEGYMDTIACHQAGVRNVVATLGTALTVGNARILRRLCDTVVLLFDGDTAGQKAAERAVEVFFAEPIDVRIATLAPHTDAKDPDELVRREGGVETLNKVLAAAIDPLEMLFGRIRASLAGLGLSARTRIIDEFTGRLLELGLDRVEKVRYQLIVKRLSQVAGVDWETMAAALGERRAKSRVRGPEATVSQRPSRIASPSEHLLGCVLCDAALLMTLADDQWPFISPEAFAQGPMRRVARAVHTLVAAEETPALQSVLRELSDPVDQSAATWLGSEIDRQTQGSAERLREHWSNWLAAAAQDLVRSEIESRMAAPAAAGTEFDIDVAELERTRQSRLLAGQDQRSMPRPVA